MLFQLYDRVRMNAFDILSTIQPTEKSSDILINDLTRLAMNDYICIKKRFHLAFILLHVKKMIINIKNKKAITSSTGNCWYHGN